MAHYCSVFGCLKNTRDDKELKVFRFPSQESRCRQWVSAIGRTDFETKSVDILNKNYYVCYHHFSNSVIKITKTRWCLHKDAVPTLQLPQPESIPITPSHSKHTQTDGQQPLINEPQLPTASKSVQTSSTLTANSPRKRKLRLQLKSEIKKRKLVESQKENAALAARSNKSPQLQKIIEAQDKLQKSSHDNRYDQEYLMFALNIYYASPSAYKIISQRLCLPDKRTLQRRVAFSISTKFDDKVVNCLESKIKKLSDAEKYCIICADEISLKRHLYYVINKDKVVGFHEIDGNQTVEIASQAFVVMARGIFSNWKQPLAYCFLSQSKNYDELGIWLDNIMIKMITIGYIVLAFTSDQGSNFLNLANNKSVTPDQPYFFINGKKIYYIFDVPHLTKSLRNNLMKYDFVYKNTESDDSASVASWNDIKQLYDIEKGKSYKMAYRLTESHVNPNNFEKMRVKYATQVLSRSVAVAICTLVENGKLPETSFGTTKFVELINNTFDILNSSSVKDDYKYKRALYQAEFQTETLRKAQNVLSGLHVINPQNGHDMTNSMKFIRGFLISINSILSLSSDLKLAGYKYLYTRRLNQDALENFFGKIRQQGVDCAVSLAGCVVYCWLRCLLLAALSLWLAAKSNGLAAASP
ncbi:transposase protein domain-containing protein [Phthorimaea operculella]|nr:transposase protein domain-containing protein [Phthorimaea operculella]